MRVLKILLVTVLVLLSVFTVSAGCGCGSPSAINRTTTTEVPEISLQLALANGKPTLAEFSSESCTYCIQMKPILKNLAVEYEGKVNIVFLDVYDDAEPTSRYGIQLVPTQIIFDSNGEELGRHVGFWPKESIIAVFQEMGIE